MQDDPRAAILAAHPQFVEASTDIASRLSEVDPDEVRRLLEAGDIEGFYNLLGITPDRAEEFHRLATEVSVDLRERGLGTAGDNGPSL